jgi:hypothetical protein
MILTTATLQAQNGSTAGRHDTTVVERVLLHEGTHISDAARRESDLGIA